MLMARQDVNLFFSDAATKLKAHSSSGDRSVPLSSQRDYTSSSVEGTWTQKTSSHQTPPGDFPQNRAMVRTAYCSHFAPEVRAHNTQLRASRLLIQVSHLNELARAEAILSDP